MEPITIIITVSAGLVAGALITLGIQKMILKNKVAAIISEAEKEAEVIKKDKMLQAKEKFLQLKSDHEKTIADRNQKISHAENRIKQKESSVQQK